MTAADLTVGEATRKGANDLVTALAAGSEALLCTLLRWDAGPELLIRVGSSRPLEYPVGGSKHFDRPWPEWLEACVERRTGYAADGTDALRAAFFDHRLISALGCAGYCTVPVVAAGAVRGVLSALGPAGWATPERLGSLNLDQRQHPELGSLSTTEDV